MPLFAPCCPHVAPLPHPQLPALLSAAQRLPRLRRLTLRDCGAQCFGWRAWRAAVHLGSRLGLGLLPLEALAGFRLRSLELLEVGGSRVLDAGRYRVEL